MGITTAQPGRPIGVNAEVTRQRIITATMRCVADAGYSKASIRDIAGAAGMTSASLYHYFPTKAELLTATVTEIRALVFPRLRAAGLRATDVAARLEAVLDEADQMMREYPYLAAFERAIRAESAAHLSSIDPTDTGFEPLRTIINDIVEDARADGTLGGDIDAAGTVDALYALTRGLTERAASLAPGAYHDTLGAAKQLIRGTLFTTQPNHRAPRRH